MNKIYNITLFIYFFNLMYKKDDLMKELTITEVLRMYEESIYSEAKEGSLVGRVVRFQIADSY